MDADRRSRWMRALARRFSRPDAGADDLVQEAWLAILRRGEGAPPPSSGWVRATLRNLAATERLRALRRRRRERRAARDERIAPPGPGEAARRELTALVEALEEPYRTAIALRYLDG